MHQVRANHVDQDLVLTWLCTVNGSLHHIVGILVFHHNKQSTGGRRGRGEERKWREGKYGGRGRRGGREEGEGGDKGKEGKQVRKDAYVMPRVIYSLMYLVYCSKCLIFVIFAGRP